MLFQSIHEALREKERPFLDIGAIPVGLKKMIGGCWMEEAKYRPEFVEMYHELCLGEFEEIGSHLKQLSLGSSSTSSPSTSSQGLSSFSFSFSFVC